MVIGFKINIVNEFSVNTAVDYPRTARTVLSGNERSLSKTFELIFYDNELLDIVKVNDDKDILYCERINLDAEEGTGYWEFLQHRER